MPLIAQAFFLLILLLIGIKKRWCAKSINFRLQFWPDQLKFSLSAAQWYSLVSVSLLLIALYLSIIFLFWSRSNIALVHESICRWFIECFSARDRQCWLRANCWNSNGDIRQVCQNSMISNHFDSFYLNLSCAKNNIHRLALDALNLCVSGRKKPTKTSAVFGSVW